jgi:dTDP-4-dehydrorhamnose 3,5-epimerase
VAHLKVSSTPLPGLSLVTRTVLGDERGHFERIFCQDELKDFLGSKHVEQANYSFTRRRGTVRGMHFQYPPAAEKKLVSCLRGKVWDVAVDIRKGSPTFGKWYAAELSSENHRSLAISEGFAHGFQSLTDDCELLYLHTHSFDPGREGAIDALDSRLAIEWPLEITERSERDRNHPAMNSEFEGVDL